MRGLSQRRKRRYLRGMRRKYRKFLGTLLTLVFVTAYALIAMAVAQGKPVQEAPGYVQGLCYAVLGLAWILPMLPLIRWMERPDAG
jgi:hypothetical protein